MDTTGLFVDSAKKFYDETRADENSGSRSWEHCYKAFGEARALSEPDFDHLSLHLAFYLASWGMYRGSSFLVKEDYRVHIPAVKEILKADYDPLYGTDCAVYKEKPARRLLGKIYGELGSYYKGVRDSVHPGVASPVSETLITKILMGTLGCAPAYDRYFLAGLKTDKRFSRVFGIESISQLTDFYLGNIEEFETLRESFSRRGVKYPQMKLIDMGFWQIGFDLENPKKENTSRE